MNNSLGRHWIIEFYDCSPSKLSKPQFIESTLQAAANAIGATIVQSNFHHFSPLGVSGVVIIQESHLTIHTWPEHGYAAVDIFTCGEMEIKKGVDLLMENLEAGRKDEKLLQRGFVFSENKELQSST